MTTRSNVALLVFLVLLAAHVSAQGAGPVVSRHLRRALEEAIRPSSLDVRLTTKDFTVAAFRANVRVSVPEAAGRDPPRARRPPDDARTQEPAA